VESDRSHSVKGALVEALKRRAVVIRRLGGRVLGPGGKVRKGWREKLGGIRSSASVEDYAWP